MSKKFEEVAGWCLIANVKENIPYGEKGEIKKGTKHFSPNTKIYCAAPLWGDGYEDIVVAGRHRGTSKLVGMVISWKKLTNWRAEYTYVPPLGGIVNFGISKWKSKEQVESCAKHLRWRQELRDAKKKGFNTINPDDALIYALSDGNVNAVKKAISRGADVNYRLRHDGFTPLSAALLSEYHVRQELVQLLFDAGANIGTLSYELMDDVSRYPSDYSEFIVGVVNQAIDYLFPLQKPDNRSV